MFSQCSSYMSHIFMIFPHVHDLFSWYSDIPLYFHDISHLAIGRSSEKCWDLRAGATMTAPTARSSWRFHEPSCTCPSVTLQALRWWRMCHRQQIAESDMGPFKIPWWIDCEKGDLILPGLLGIMIAHSRETYQPTSIMRWDRGIFNGSDMVFCFSSLKREEV